MVNMKNNAHLTIATLFLKYLKYIILSTFRFGSLGITHKMSQISAANHASPYQATPPNAPMSQETFDYLWNTLGEVTDNG